MSAQPIVGSPAGRLQKRHPFAASIPASHYQSQPEFSDSELGNPVRKLCFNMCLVLVFLRFSMLHQTLDYALNVRLYLMYIFGLPPLLGVIASGGIRRVFQGRPALYWCGFAVWIMLAVPFSSWKGASAELLYDYLRTDISILLIVAGLTLTWADCEKLLSAGALSSLVALITARFFQDESGYMANRMGLQMGTVSNPNDYACHLILVLSFLLWVALGSRSKFRRILAIAGIGAGMVLILKSASRGAEMGLAAAVLIYLFRATRRQRMALILLVPVVAVMILTFVPDDALRRLQSFSAGGGSDMSAVESTESRQYLLRTSLQYTFEFPLFGVGPGQFASYEGGHNTIGGTTHGSWHETHNSYTQASSECGIPAGILFVAGALSTILLLGKGLRDARRRPDSRDIQNAFFCVLLGTVGFYVTIAFLNFAYMFYEPFLAGLAIAMWRAAKEEFRIRDLNASESPVQPPSRFAFKPGKLQFARP